MRFHLKMSQRHIAQVYAENFALTLCVFALLPVLFSVIGIVILLPLIIGMKNSAIKCTIKNLKNTTRAVQIALGVLIIASCSSGIYCWNKEMDQTANMHIFDDRFEYKWVLDLKMGKDFAKVAEKVGVEDAETLLGIHMHYHLKMSTFRDSIEYYRTAAAILKSISITAFIYVIILQLGWLWPLSNKIASGELRFNKHAMHPQSTLRGKNLGDSKDASIADEIIKLAVLRDKGDISEAEYSKVKQGILRQASI